MPPLSWPAVTDLIGCNCCPAVVGESSLCCCVVSVWLHCCVGLGGISSLYDIAIRYKAIPLILICNLIRSHLKNIAKDPA